MFWLERATAKTSMSLAAAISTIAFHSTSVSAAVVISSGATNNMVCSNGVCVPTAKDAVLNADDLTSMLATGNVKVSTGAGTLATEVEDITVLSGFSWSSANGLTLDAYRSIGFKAGAAAVNGVGAVALVTNDGGSDGQLSFLPAASLSFASTESSLAINGRAYTLENSIASLASAIAANPGGNFALAVGYDASQDGAYRASPIAASLQGDVEGLGNAISNLSIKASQTSKDDVAEIGLFSEIEYPATVANLTLTNLQYRVSNPYSYVGGLAGRNFGHVINDNASGSIHSTSAEVGGLVGDNTNTISSSHASVDIKAPSMYAAWAGGLAGGASGTIELSSASGSVDGPSANATGGLVGMANGLAIVKCFANGRVTSNWGGADLGGLVGYGSAYIQNSYSTGSVRNESGSGASYGGGLVGESEYGSISTSYSTGSVSSVRGWAGGFIGGSLDQTSSSYWNITTSKSDQGVGNGRGDGVTGLTSSELRSGLPNGFDPAIWAEKKSVNHGFPYLINNPPPKD